MNDLIVPVPAPDAGASTSTTSAAQIIRTLAQQHGVVYQPTPLDAFAGDVSRLSDAEVPADEIADLVVALKRAGVLDSGQAASLHGDYLVQTRG